MCVQVIFVWTCTGTMIFSCPGDLASKQQAELTTLNEFLKDSYGEGDEKAGNVLGEPPKKKQYLEKENATTSSAAKKRWRKRKHLKEIQVRSSK